MSDTPRTDWLAERNYNRQQVPAEFARELERENARLLSNEASVNDQICEMAKQLSKLREAAQSVVDRWETPLWENVEPTAAFIYRLRDSLPNV